MEIILQIAWYFFLYIYSSYERVKSPSARITFTALPILLDIIISIILSVWSATPFFSIFLDIFLDILIFAFVWIINVLKRNGDK